MRYRPSISNWLRAQGERYTDGVRYESPAQIWLGRSASKYLYAPVTPEPAWMKTPTLDTRTFGTKHSAHGGPVTGYLYDGYLIGTIERANGQYYVNSTLGGYQGSSDPTGWLFTRATARAWLWAQSCFSKAEEER